MVGLAFAALGLADFALFNFGIWDFYSGLNISGSFIEPFTPIAAGVVSGLMISMATKTPDSAAGVRWAFSLVGALTISLVLISSYSASAIGIEWRVRGGSLAMCPHHSLNEMAEAFLADPRWDTFEVLQGSHAVNLSGAVSIDGRPAEVLLQFMVYGDAFELYAVEIDGEQMPHLVGYEVLEAACEAAD